MAQNHKTLYDVLGVPSNAKVTDITRAYNRIRAEQLKESAAPDARLLAAAKEAHETLTDPGRREAYDRSIAGASFAEKFRKPILAAASLAAVLAIGAGYHFASRSDGAPGGKPLEPQELLAAITPQIGLVRMALMSGEVRDLGTAVAIGENEMVTTCRGMTAGAKFSVKMGEFSTNAEVGNANHDLDICTLSVKNTNGTISVRSGLPAASEKLEAVFLGPTGKPLLRPASVSRFIDDPQGQVIEIRSAIPLPNGTPVFDRQARLAAIVTASRAAADGVAIALPGMRIIQGRGVFGAYKPAREPEPAPKIVAPPEKSAEPPTRRERESVEEVRAKALEKAISESEGLAK